MILVGQYDSPFVRRVAFAMHWYRMPFKRNTMSVFGDAERMREINPLGRIPSLILDDGETLVDSWAILDHLDSIASQDRRLMPEHGRSRRRAAYLTAVAAGAVDKAGAIVYEKMIRPRDMRYQPWIERCMVQLRTALHHLNVAVGDAWLVPDRLTHADAMLAGMTWYVTERVPEAGLHVDHASILKHYDRMMSLDEFRKTAPSADEAMPSEL